MINTFVIKSIGRSKLSHDSIVGFFFQEVLVLWRLKLIEQYRSSSHKDAKCCIFWNISKHLLIFVSGPVNLRFDIDFFSLFILIKYVFRIVSSDQRKERYGGFEELWN